MRLLTRALLAAVALAALPARADFHLWQITEFYSNAAGNVQFVELQALSGGQQFLNNHTITSTNGGATNSFTFTNLSGDSANKRMLVGTQSFAAMGIVTPDFVVADNFFFRGNFVINFAEGQDVWNNSTGALAVPTDGGLSLYRNGVTDTNTPQNYANATATLFPTPVAADVNGDGRSDIVWRNVQTGQVYRMTMNGGAITAAGFVFTEPDTSWAVVAEGDFNGDGRIDLLWRNSSTGQVYAMPFNAAGEPFTGAVLHVEPNLQWRIIGTPDINGDGISDLLWYNASAGGQLYGMIVNEGLVLGVQGMVHVEPDTQWRVVATGDFSRTGRDQLMWHNSSSGALYLMGVSVEAGVFRTTGQLFYQEPNLSWRVVGAGDFDGDLKVDLLWRNSATGQVFVMLLNGAAIKGGSIVHTEPNADWRIVAIGDFDGDFRNDLLWRHATTGQVYQMRLNGAAVAGGAVIHVEPNASWHIMGVREYTTIGVP